MNFLSQYGLFLLKLISIVGGVLVSAAGMVAISQKGKVAKTGKLTVTPLDKQFNHYKKTLLEVAGDKKAIKLLKKNQKSEEKKNKKERNDSKKRLFILNFDGDIKASALLALREEITALLLIAEKTDEVLIKLSSGGGLVNAYGLAAAQLERIRAANLKLTISVDSVAASGGYLMACIADHLIAAPFAIIGSIGVIAQMPNLHRWLQRQHIDFEQITAGQYKRTLTLLGKNTSEGRKKLQIDIDETHDLFKDFILKYRKTLDIDKVATGEHWYASQAKALNLVDELKTSDDYILEQSRKNPSI